MIVDLSYPLKPDMLVWPGGGRPVYEWVSRINSEGWNETHIKMPVHTGTHVDAPLHMCPEGDPLDAIELSRFWGDARLFRMDEIPNDQEITLETLQNSGFISLGGAEIFVMQTGIEPFSETRDYNYKYPVPTIELLGWLAQNGMKTYMTDATSVDRVNDIKMRNHKFLFERGIPIIENLKNLSKLPANANFTICAMPLLLPGREGSPCRAAAIV
ncbi:MAG: cyclase family protein [Synergistaceae bacterium]|nr:cyclase family protein [Synergistaceae bacterium]